MKLSLRPSLNWLFAFVPITIGLSTLGHPAPLVFFAAALAIVPIASVDLSQATEYIGLKYRLCRRLLHEREFGNAPELIIAVVALQAGLLDMVRASLIGAILANLPLALGLAFLLGRASTTRK